MSFPAAHALKLIERTRLRGRLGHAYLITGAAGTGLEEFAVSFLNLASGETRPDLDAWEKHGALVLRPESKSRQIRAEVIRSQVEPFLYITRSGAAHRFCVFVDADRMNVTAQNVFLRTLEEPPPLTLFLLLSTQPESLLETTLSRVIRVPLLTPPTRRQMSEAEQHLVALLAGMAKKSTSGSLASALSLHRAFDDILETVHSRIEKQFEREFEEEKKHLRQTTDVSSGWLDEKEKGMLATVEAHYLQERDRLMELMLSWLGDVLRHQVGAPRLDLPEHAEATRALASRWDANATTRKLSELRKLHSHLQTNAQEALALEAAFIAAFA
jgi:DNA polymerase III subunit delta'